MWFFSKYLSRCFELATVCRRYKMCKLRSCCSQTRAPVPKSEMNRAQPCNDHSHNHNTLHIVPEKAQSSGKYTMEGCPQLIDQKGTQEKSHHCKGAKTLYSKRQTGKLSKLWMKYISWILNTNIILKNVVRGCLCVCLFVFLAVQNSSIGDLVTN